MTTSYLPRRSFLNAVALVTTGSRVELLVSVEERVERGLVIVPAGDQQAFHGAGRLAAGGCSACQLFDVDILELNQAGRAGPFAVLVLAAVVLEGDAAAVGQVGDGGPGDDGLAVERDLHGLAFDGDLEMVPLADRLVGLGAGRGGGAELGRCLGIDADAVDLARADRPAPDVGLKPAVAAEVDAGIRIRQREFQFLAVDVLGVGAIGQDVRDVLVDERRLLEPPIDLQDEVADTRRSLQRALSPLASLSAS